MDAGQVVLRVTDEWPCCPLATVRVDALPDRESQFFARFVAHAVTAMVLLHHVVTEKEWTWYANESDGEHCDADDHARDRCHMIRGELVRLGHDTELVKYPGKTGLQFRSLAQAAGLATIGMSAFLFHPIWGPRVHLRVLATTAELEVRPQLSGDELCDRCGLCLLECPAKATSEDSFVGLQCRSYREARGEYKPHSPNGLLLYCKRCVDVCSKGQQLVPE